MALTTYRSKQAVDTIPKRNAAYERIAELVIHLQTFNLNLLRIERMPDLFVEVDLNDPLPAAHVDHLGLQGPV